ncbi:MAG: hypothetical protein K6G44_06755 [Lentisphaeria bacterium]|nr:hypothetical protein [Lentisphaeria bacterium]
MLGMSNDNCLFKIFKNKKFIAIICLFLIVLVSAICYLKNIYTAMHLSNDIGKTLPAKFTFTNHILSHDELSEMINKFSENETLKMLGKNTPEISSEDNGIENHIYSYFYNPDIIKKYKSETPNNYGIGFELVFQNSKLFKATEFRKSIPKAYYECDTFRSMFVDKLSMDSIVEALGEPEEIQYENGKITYQYRYRKTSDLLFSSGHVFVYIKIISSQDIINDVSYEICDLLVEEHNGRLFIKQLSQICHCLGKQALNDISYEPQKESLIPLEQYGIRSMDQLKNKAKDLLIICEQPLVISFKP